MTMPPIYTKNEYDELYLGIYRIVDAMCHHRLKQGVNDYIFLQG